MKPHEPDRDKHEVVYTIVGLTICLISLAFGSYVFLVVCFQGLN